MTYCSQTCRIGYLSTVTREASSCSRRQLAGQCAENKSLQGAHAQMGFSYHILLCKAMGFSQKGRRRLQAYLTTRKLCFQDNSIAAGRLNTSVTRPRLVRVHATENPRMQWENGYEVPHLPEELLAIASCC